MGIHNYERIYQNTLQQLKNANISEKNKKLISAFVNDCLLEGMSICRQTRYLGILRILAEMLQKDFDAVEIADLKEVVSKIQQNPKYTPWTKQLYKVMLRRFYKWQAKTKHYPPLVDWISIRISRAETRLPSEGELLTEQDIQKLLPLAHHPRDRAFLSVLWESGARVSEIGNLKISNVLFDQYGTLLSLRGKTGSRKIRVVFSTQYLSTWIANHPLKEDPIAPLWINVGTTNNRKPMDYGAIRVMMKRLFHEAGIKKRSNPHLFRHSRATFMAHHLTEFQMNQYFGWIQGSGMPATYVHMSGRDVDNAILKMNGVAVDEKEQGKNSLLSIKCARCDMLNSNQNKHCSKCGGILDLRYAMEQEERRKGELEERNKADNLMSLLLKDKDIQKVIFEKMRNMNLVLS